MKAVIKALRKKRRVITDGGDFVGKSYLTYDGYCLSVRSVNGGHLGIIGAGSLSQAREWIQKAKIQ